jgi:phosphoserine aminotransferase
MNPYRYNFSAGPGALPESVLYILQESIHCVPGLGLSVLGVSHRSDWFEAVVAETEANVRKLLDLPESYHVLMLQGGSSLQFSMIPMLLLRGRQQPAEYLDTGYWSAKAIPEARREGPVNVLWSGKAEGYTRLPTVDELQFSKDASYLHYVSNETVEGLQFGSILGHDSVPRVCDMSSDFLSQPIDAQKFSLIYAHSQKNLGPAGVTLVVLDDALLARAPDDLHSILDYRPHAYAHSIYNTPPVFAIYALMLVTRWLLKDVGGVEAMGELNRRKAAALYQVLDSNPHVYRARAARENRSLMNVVFNLPTAEMEQQFLHEADIAGLYGLAGHRTLGGVRVSLYNGVTLEAVHALCNFMESFQQKYAIKIAREKVCYE